MLQQFEKKIIGGLHQTAWNDLQSSARAFSYTEIEQMVLQDLPAVLNAVPRLPFRNLTLEDLETAPLGTYRLSEAPSFNLLKALPKFRQSSSEVIIFKLEDTWIIGLHEGAGAPLPLTFQSISHRGRFAFMLHSHPGIDECALYPGNNDLDNVYSTPQGQEYISCARGLLTYKRPTELPGGLQPQAWRRVWRDYVHNRGLTEITFAQAGPWNVWKDFLTKFYDFKIIPWSNSEQIEKLIRAI